MLCVACDWAELFPEFFVGAFIFLQSAYLNLYSHYASHNFKMVQQIFMKFNASEFYEDLHKFTAIPIMLGETQARNFARKLETKTT